MRMRIIRDSVKHPSFECCGLNYPMTGFFGKPMTSNGKKTLSILMLTLFVCGQAGAIDISVIGLADGVAVLIIDNGKPQTLRDGQTAPGGITLISANSDYAEIDVDGKRRRLTLGAGVYSAPVAGDNASTTLISDSNGHFISNGTINGVSMRFLVDTGASMIALGISDARRAGINYLAGEKAYANTANGVATVYRVQLDNVRLGNIAMNNVDAMVHATSDLPVVLLGMSFLSQLDMKREGDYLTLIRRY